MISSISSATQTQPVAQPPKKATPPAPKPAASTDSVTLSKAAQARLDTLQEATETAAQTAKEAETGDLQAQRLLAKETPAKPVAK